MRAATSREVIMRFRSAVSAALLLLLALGVPPVPAHAEDDGGGNQLEDNLSSYTGVNATGYLGPLRDALGSALNSGLYMYGGVPRDGFHARLDLRGMLVSFGDDDRTFQAVTESWFGEPQYATAPTVVGDERAVLLTDPSSGATFMFPGGLNIGRLGLAAPQLTIGALWSTEFIGRYFAIDTEDEDIGKISYKGFGARHGISNHFPNLPVDVSVMGFWQNLTIGDDLLDATMLTFGAQAGKTMGILHGYGGLSYDSIKMKVVYQSDVSGEDEDITVDFGNKSTAHLTLGATLHLGFLSLNGEFNKAAQTSFGFGLGLGL
jgi:hypothetical protein